MKETKHTAAKARTEIVAGSQGISAKGVNEIFNITNGNTFRWQHMWPKVARMLDRRSPILLHSR